MKNFKNIIIISVFGLIMLIVVIISFNNKKPTSTYNPQDDYIERTDVSEMKGSGSMGFGGAKK